MEKDLRATLIGIISLQVSIARGLALVLQTSYPGSYKAAAINELHSQAAKAEDFKEALKEQQDKS